MNFVTLLLALAILGVVFDTPAHAYLDPGTGSMIFQAVIGVFLAAAATGKLWWAKVKGLFGGNTDKNND